MLPGPLGLSERESEHPSPLGLCLLDSDKGAMLPQKESGQTGLNFKHIDQNGGASPSCEEVFQENTLNLDSLLRTSSYSCGDHILLPLEGDQSSHSQGVLQRTHIEELPLTEKVEEQDDISDCTLSWLFFSSSTDLLEETPACDDLNPPQDVPFDDINALNNQGVLIALSEPSSPMKNSDRTSDTNTEASSLLAELLSCEYPPSPLSPECSGEVDPQGVSEELLHLPLSEEGGLPPSQGRETVSPEARDKGLFLEPVTDLPTVGNATPEGLPESCFSHNTVPADCIRESPEAVEGSVPLLDLEVPDCDSNLSLSPTSHTLPTCTGASSNSPSEEPEREHALAALIPIPISEHRGEGDLSFPCPSLNCNASTEAPSLRVLSDGDAPVLGDLPSDCCSEKNDSQDLMEGKTLSDVKHVWGEEMALDQCLTTNEFHDEEVWDLKPPEGVQDHNVPDLQTEQSDGERWTDSNSLRLSGCHKTGTFDFPVQELSGSSPEPEWTSEESVETISLSKMVVSDSMPMVSTASQREEDVSPLKAVFDALDQDGDGFVRIEEFMAFAAAYGADQVRFLSCSFLYVDILVYSRQLLDNTSKASVCKIKTCPF